MKRVKKMSRNEFKEVLGRFSLEMEVLTRISRD